jgi:hypothetical protein
MNKLRVVVLHIGIFILCLFSPRPANAQSTLMNVPSTDVVAAK